MRTVRRWSERALLVARSVALRRSAARCQGGKSKPSREISDLKAQLANLAEEVIAGELETGRAAVANQLINTRLRAIELERKVRDADEFEERLNALENLTRNARSRGGHRWG